MTPLQKAAQSVIDRWDAPAWKDQPHTAEYIAGLRKALDAEIAQAPPPAFWLNECGQLSATRGWAERNSPGSKLTPLYMHPPQPQATTAVPEGYVLVPIEPTAAMISAGRAAPCTADIEDLDEDYCAVYKAMLEAAQGEKP